VKFFKGIVIAESKETCVVYGMPKAVVDEGYADFVLPADKIPGKIGRNYLKFKLTSRR